MSVTLVELLAYVGDQLSYQQDAVLPKLILARRAGVPPCGSMRGWWTIQCRRLQCAGMARIFVNDAGVLLPGQTVLLTRIPGMSIDWRPEAISCVMPWPVAQQYLRRLKIRLTLSSA